MNYCECSCGMEIKEDRRFVKGHNGRRKLSPLKGRKQSEEHIRKRVEKIRGQKRSLESRKRMSESQKGENHPMYGKKQSEETIRKRVEKIKGRPSLLKGRKQSEETIRKRVEKIKGRKQSEEHIRKRVEKIRGKKHSLESRKRISEKLKGRKRSLETKKRQSESRKGIIFTEEHKENLSISANNRISPKYKSGYFYSEKMQKEIFYQSSLELRALEMFEKDSNIWSIERCNFSIRYRMNGSYHSYSPDYFLNERIVIEVKALWKMKDEGVLAKIEAGKKYCKEKGFEFKVLTEKEIYR